MTNRLAQISPSSLFNSFIVIASPPPHWSINAVLECNPGPGSNDSDHVRFMNDGCGDAMSVIRWVGESVGAVVQKSPAHHP